MTFLAIPNAINSAVSALSHHGHKKGATDGTSGSDAQSGTTQSLFGSLLDTAEQVIGIQTPTSNPAVGGATSTLTGPSAQKLSPAALISAARSALPKA